MTGNAKKHRTTQIRALGQGDVLRAHNTRTRIADPEIAPVNTNITVFLNKSSATHLKISHIKLIHLAMLMRSNQ
jgi:hypothetical protein